LSSDTVNLVTTVAVPDVVGEAVAGRVVDGAGEGGGVDAADEG
jgi:hypothetical protein